MCSLEVIGDWYRPCNHFVQAYYTGNKTDCKRTNCGLSEAHVHRAPNCGCPQTGVDERRIRNMFLFPCEDCKQAEWARRTSS